MKSEELNLFVLLRNYPVGLAVTKKIDNLLNYLHKNDIKIRVLSYRSKFKQPYYNADQYPILFDSIGYNLKLSSLHKAVAYFIKGLRIIQKGKKHGFNNIFYCIGPLNIENFLFVFWARLFNYKIVFDINEDYSFFEDKVKIISRFKIITTKRLDVLTYKWADAITVVSTYLRNKYMAMTDKPVLLVPVTAVENFRTEKNVHQGLLKVVYAGTFDRKDGVEAIIEGFLMFSRNYKKVNLILMGKSELQKEYQNRFGNNDNIFFKGYVPDDQFYGMLRDADILCMCRTNSDFANAGFPFKLGEYLATGNPVISTRASDVCDYLTSDDAYLVDFDSPEEIAAAFQKIAGNQDEARRIGLNGFRKYQKYFSPESNGKILLEGLLRL